MGETVGKMVTVAGSAVTPAIDEHLPEWHAFSRELHGLLEAAIDAIPNGMREVFVLREVEGLSTAEAAGCLDVSEDVVKTLLSRARATLRRLLMEQAGATAPDAFAFTVPAAIVSSREYWRGSGTALHPWPESLRTRGSFPLPPAAGSARRSADHRSPT